MPIRLTWTPRSDADSQTVYRDTSNFNANSLPAPLSTLLSDVDRYEDLTASDVDYYYAIETISSGRSVVSSILFVQGGGGSSAIDTDYAVTVSSSSVATDLYNFPLKIDLRDMPAAF